MNKAATLFVFIVSFAANAQTNNPPPDLRTVNGKTYNVNKSPEWMLVTIPAGSKLDNATVIRYSKIIKPQNVFFSFPHSVGAPTWPTVYVRNFPFNPANFRSFQNIIYTVRPLQLKVFPLSHATTNYDALGHATIIPAKPQFDFGIPTNSVK